MDMAFKFGTDKGTSPCDICGTSHRDQITRFCGKNAWLVHTMGLVPVTCCSCRDLAKLCF